MKYKHIFGPVASRRLGVSLGVDLVTHKICSLDCVYCECGKTTDLTLKRQAYVSFEAVKTELSHYWKTNQDPDYITFSGSGEPTLNSEIGRVISYIKKEKPGIKVAVLTNSTLLKDIQVRDDLALCDLVVPSLDAVSPHCFDRINRPCEGLSPNDVLKGIQAFAAGFDGKINLEIFVLHNVNDHLGELEKLKKAILSIDPDLVQLNTLDRPGTMSDIHPASGEVLERVKSALGMENVQIIAKAGNTKNRGGNLAVDLESAVLETIHRRPCTCRDLVNMLNGSRQKIKSLLEGLMADGKIEARHQERGVFYQTVKPDTNPPVKDLHG